MRINADVLASSLQNDLSPYIDQNLSWSIDCTPQQVACYRLKDSLLKKFNQESRPSEKACLAAKDKFLAVNARLKDWSFVYNFIWEEELVGFFKEELYKFWYCDPSRTEPLVSCWDDIFSKGRLGPGANISALGTDLYTKLFASPLSSTKPLTDVWSLCCGKHPQFREAYCSPAWVAPIEVVDGNKSSFVNKTQDIARMIAVEPTINMWFQLGFAHHLESRLKTHFGIDLGKQPDVNRRLATAGSIFNHLSTIDLESASDSMSLRMLEQCLPRSFFGWLLKLRSPTSVLPDGSVVVNNMVSTMGNGFTFPLQTIVFTCAVVAVYRYLGIPYHIRSRGDGACALPGMISNADSRNLSVFGDDIICESRVTRHVIHLLTLLGFVVNSNKSYVKGPFRESCGTDVYLGVDVRPVFIKKLVTLQDAFATINRLNLWSSNHGIPLRNLVQYIIRCFPKVTRYPVPPDEDDSAGLHLPRELLDVTRHRNIRSFWGSIRYVSFVPIFYGYRIDVEEEKLRGSVRHNVYNLHGLYIAFLAGSVCGYRVTVRQTVTRYITKRRLSPNWGYLPPQKYPKKTHFGYCRTFLWSCEVNL